MKIWKRIRVLGAILLIFVLGGCKLISDPVSLMKTPELPADKETLKAIIYSELPDGSKSLIRAREDEDTNQIHFVDLDNDGKNEAVVFYELPDKDGLIQGMIFKNIDGSWQKQFTFDGGGQVLESLQFKDLTNDGKPEIVAGFTSIDNKGDRDPRKGLIVYRYTGKSLERILELPYYDYVIDDLNGDHMNDLTVIFFQKNEFSYVTTYQYKDSFIELDRLEMRPYIDGYYNIAAGKVYRDQEGNTKEGIVLDASMSGGNSSYSSLIVMDNNKLVSVFKDESKMFKPYRVVSEDVDGDGIIEIGFVDPAPGWDYFKEEEQPLFVTYKQWDGKQDFKFVSQQYRDFKNGFELGFFPKDWHNRVTVDTKYNKDQYLRFYLTDTGKTVAEIKFFTWAQWEKKHDDWKYLYQISEKVIGYKKYGDFDVDINKERMKHDVPPIERNENISE